MHEGESMFTVAVIGQKGGSGKTTVALGIATAAARAQKTTIVIDLDPQANASNWSDRRQGQGLEEPVVVNCQVGRLMQTLDKAEHNHADIAIIDTPGKGSEAGIAAAKAADFVLIPIQPQIFDMETLATVRDMLRIGGNPPAAIVVNRAPIQGQRHNEAMELAKEDGFEVCPVYLSNRNVFGDAMIHGKTAHEYKPDSKAADELINLWKYTLTHARRNKQ